VRKVIPDDFCSIDF
jgi:hypothetical protein